MGWRRDGGVMSESITFVDLNPHREFATKSVEVGVGWRVIYSSIYNIKNQLIATYRCGGSPIGHEDGWTLADDSTDTLYSDWYPEVTA